MCNLTPTLCSAKRVKKLYDKGTEKVTNNINGYLVEADDIIIESRKTPLSNVSEIGIKNRPTYDGYYLFTEEEMLELIKKQPESKQYFRKQLTEKRLTKQKCNDILSVVSLPAKNPGKRERSTNMIVREVYSG